MSQTSHTLFSQPTPPPIYIEMARAPPFLCYVSKQGTLTCCLPQSIDVVMCHMVIERHMCIMKGFEKPEDTQESDVDILII
jgi:predicted nucleotidyltransferase